jgi:hypothetical protein
MKPDITYDKDGNQVPSQEFLSMIIIMLRKAKAETGISLVGWLESFEELDNEVDTFDDASLRQAIYKVLKENYLDDEA